MIKIAVLWLCFFTNCYAPYLNIAPVHRTDKILQFDSFMVGWSDALDSPVWAYYYLLREDKRFSLKRPLEPFKRDIRVHDRNISSSVYLNSGYDRGHLVPSRAMGSYFGLQTQLQTYFLSNIVPQKPKVNRVQIRSIENQIYNFSLFELAELEEVFIILEISNNKLKELIRVPDSITMTVLSTDFEENKQVKNFFFIENK